MTDARRPALIAAIYLGTFMAVLDVSIVNVALPALQSALLTDIAGLQWVVDAYALCLSAFMLSAGPIGDRYGRKLSWLAGVGVFTLGSAICAAAPDLPTLLAGRMVQGVAGAFLIPGALSILTQAFPDPRQRAHVIGGWSSFTAMSLIVGPALGGVLVETAGWPSIFLINLPVGLLTFLLGRWGIRETAHPDHAALDPAGQALSILWLGALTFCLISAGERGWASEATALSLAVAALGFLAFVIVEARTPRPILPLGLFRNAGFAVTNFASFVLGFSAYSSLFFLSLFLQRVQGWSPAAAGWRLAPQFVFMALLALIFGRLTARRGAYALMIAGYGLIGLAMLAMGAVPPETSYPAIAALFSLLGIGMGLAIPATSMEVMASVPRERSGMASATMNALRQAGMTIGIALLGTLMSTRAVALLAVGLEEAGVPRAATVAAAAITGHEIGADGGLGSDGFNVLAAEALAGGIHAAMICAGAAALLAAALLTVVRARSRGRGRSSAATMDSPVQR